VPFLEDKFGEWKPVSRTAGIAWLCSYALFLLYALTNRSGFLFLDFVNLIIHEGGHFIFSWFGNTIMILGGTLANCSCPSCAPSISSGNAKPPASLFAASGSSKIFPYIGTYMADARTAALPLVGSGDSDWEILFTQWGLLAQDQKIGGIVRTLAGSACSPLPPGSPTVSATTLP